MIPFNFPFHLFTTKNILMIVRKWKISILCYKYLVVLIKMSDTDQRLIKSKRCLIGCIWNNNVGNLEDQVHENESFIALKIQCYRLCNCNCLSKLDSRDHY